MVTIDGEEIQSITVDGNAIEEVTADGEVVWQSWRDLKTYTPDDGETTVDVSQFNRSEITVSGGSGASISSGGSGDGGEIKVFADISDVDELVVWAGEEATSQTGGKGKYDGGDGGTGEESASDGSGGGAVSYVETGDGTFIAAGDGGGGGGGSADPFDTPGGGDYYEGGGGGAGSRGGSGGSGFIDGDNGEGSGNGGDGGDGGDSENTNGEDGEDGGWEYNDSEDWIEIEDVGTNSGDGKIELLLA